MRRIARTVFALAVCGAVALNACGEGPREEGAEGPETEESAATAGEPAEADAGAQTAADEAPAGRSTAQALEPVDESGVTGSARLTRREGSSEIVVTLDGSTDESYMAHVHTGTCGRDRGVALVLADFRDEDGRLKSVTVAETGDFNPLGTHFVQVHRDDGTPVACTNLDIEPRLGGDGAIGEWDSNLDSAEKDAGSE